MRMGRVARIRSIGFSPPVFSLSLSSPVFFLNRKS